MHEFTPEVEALAAEVLKYSLERLKDDPPLDGPRSAEDLFNEVGNTITAKGLGGHEALQVFTNVLAKACISTDHPRNLAFIPSAPSEYANLFDYCVVEWLPQIVIFLIDDTGLLSFVANCEMARLWSRRVIAVN